MNHWQVIYFNENGQKRIIEANLPYNEAVKLYQRLNTERLQGLNGYTFTDYEAMP